jgi:hypothetical protein
MWIRSQNKRILSNVDEVLVTFVDENKCFISGFWGTGTDTLGVYSSKCKALMILDKIESYLEYSHNIVFQMPQDDEVGL